MNHWQLAQMLQTLPLNSWDQVLLVLLLLLGDLPVFESLRSLAEWLVVAGLMQTLAREGIGVINLGYYQVNKRFRALDPYAILTGEGQFLGDLVNLLLPDR